MDQRYITGMIVFSVFWGIAGALQWTSPERGAPPTAAPARWYTCAFGAAAGSAIIGAACTYKTYADLAFPERGIEWSGTALTCAVYGGVLGAIAGAIRSWRAARKTR
jgi:hypothetical protein